MSNESRYFMNYMRRFKRTEDIDLKFAFFMRKVDRMVFDRIGYDLLDLPDEMYHDMFTKGYSHEQVANVVINNYNNYFVYS